MQRNTADGKIIAGFGVRGQKSELLIQYLYIIRSQIPGKSTSQDIIGIIDQVQCVDTGRKICQIVIPARKRSFHTIVK